MSNQTTRRQHYVWKHHLTAWEVGGTIAVLRKGANGFRTDPLNVAVKKDFYRLPRLNRADFTFFEQFIASLPIPEQAKDVARGWTEPAIMAAATRELLRSQGRLTQDAERAIEDYEIQADESYHSAIEKRSLSLLDDLRQGRVDFWPHDDLASMSFCYFIALQHMRTKRMADRVIADQDTAAARDDLIRRWPILRHILATNVGMTLFVERAGWHLRVIEAAGEVEFITADQPIMNLLAAATRNDMAFYYPLGPRRALLLEHADNPSEAPGSDVVDADVVKSLNRRIFDYAHEQVFGRDLDYLQSLDLGCETSAGQR